MVACKFSGVRARSMNMDQIVMRGSKTWNPRRAQSTFVRSPSKTEDDNPEPTTLSPLLPLQNVYTEHF